MVASNICAPETWVGNTPQVTDIVVVSTIHFTHGERSGRREQGGHVASHVTHGERSGRREQGGHVASHVTHGERSGRREQGGHVASHVTNFQTIKNLWGCIPTAK